MSDPGQPPRDPVGVLFVCHANLCRSPLAEAIFRELVGGHGWTDRFRIDSAGTWAAEGMSPAEGSIQVGTRFGLTVSGASRPFTPDDLFEFDHVLVMDRSNAADVERLRRLSAFGPVLHRGRPQRAQVRLLRTVHDRTTRGPEVDVPDPYRRGPEAFAHTYDILDRACRRLLEEFFADERPLRREE